MKTIMHIILVAGILSLISCGDTSNPDTTDTTTNVDTTTITENVETNTKVITEQEPTLLDTINQELEDKTEELEELIDNL